MYQKNENEMFERKRDMNVVSKNELIEIIRIHKDIDAIDITLI